MRLSQGGLDYSEGFSSGNDLFERKKLASMLENIITKVEDENLVFAVDDDWGTGKTTFFKLWKSENEANSESEFDMIYYDAYENDYQEDAFLSIVSHIYSLAESREDKSLLKILLEKSVSVGKILFKTGSRIAISFGTAGLVQGTVLESAKDEITEAVNKPIEEFLEERITKVDTDKKTINEFKKVLEKIANDKKIVFVIDELDRARPDFSLDILEKIKHVFNSKNLIFILSMNRKQFEKSISHRYGDINSSLYLSKFINHWFALPKNMGGIHTRSSTETYSNVIFSRHFNQVEVDDLIESTMTYLLIKAGCSLREIEKAWSTFALVVSSCPKKPTDYDAISLVIVCFLHTTHSDILKKIKERIYNTDELIDALNLENIGNIQDRFRASKRHIMKIIYHDFSSDEEYEELLNHEESKNYTFPYREGNYTQRSLEILVNMNMI